jgi:PadR family transcriptional regulator AphA
VWRVPAELPGSITVGPVTATPADRSAEGDLSLGEWVCLALVASGATHGWAVVRELEPDGQLGTVWTLSRQLTYRAIEQLSAKALLRRTGHEPARGRGRVLLAPTAKGRRAVMAWLDRPARHIRDVRTETLLKLALRERFELDNLPFLRAQREALDPLIDSLLGPGHATSDMADILRREQARATHRFLDTAMLALSGERGRPGASRPVTRLSARNQLSGMVTEVVHGDVMSTVRMRLPDGQTITAAITRDAALELALAPGDPATAIIKATEVLLSVP